MIRVDLSNVWREMSLSDLLSLEGELSAVHAALLEGAGADKASLGWLDLVVDKPTAEHKRILAAAQRIRQTSDALVVIGVGASALGSRAAIELLQGVNRNLRRNSKGEPMILFAGNNLSSRAWSELMWMLDRRDFSLCVVSKSGDTVEPSIAFRNLRWMLERRYGVAEARQRIYAITDPEQGVLGNMARREGWECFPIPANVGGSFSVLSAAGLLPMAVAGIDLAHLFRGAAKAKRAMDLRSFENPVWLYAAVRYLMHRRGKAIELVESFEPGFASMGAWWQQLFAGAEGKEGQGLFPACAELTDGFHCLGQLLQQGQRNIFETLVRFDPPARKATVFEELRIPDGLNALTGWSLESIQAQVYQAAMTAHSDSGCPSITIDCGPLSDETLGELFYFFELTCAISARMLGVDPFDQPALESYKQSLAVILD